MKKEIYYDAPKFLVDFLNYDEVIKNKSSSTVNEYYLDLTTFLRYIKLINGLTDMSEPFDRISINDVTIDLLKTITLSDLHSFLVYCKNDRSNNATTRARKVSTIRSFFKYLTSHVNLLENNPAELLDAPKISTSLPKHLTLEESLELLNSVNSIDNPNRARDYCIITLFLNCGLRLSELCNINLPDIKSDGSLTIVGKGNKERIVYLNEACLSALEDYLKVRPVEGVSAEHKNALFISRNKRRISNKTVQHIVYTALEKCGLDGKGLSTHKLRHTAATLMYQHGGVDVRTLQNILGHANLGTTQIYTHVSDNQIKSAIDANPLSKTKK